MPASPMCAEGRAGGEAGWPRAPSLLLLLHPFDPGLSCAMVVALKNVDQ